MRIIVFTDLDGTLLRYPDYSFEEALPALKKLRGKGVPLIICSSKTRKEIEYYREKLKNNHPFISENGGGVFVPEGYFSGETMDGIEGETTGGYILLRLGARYEDLRRCVRELREEGYKLQGFGDMSPEDIMELTGLPEEQAVMSKMRDFDEPFLCTDKAEKISLLFKRIKEKGYRYTKGRYFHIMGNSDKGRAVSFLVKLYRREFGDIVTVALGDSLNDLPMLKGVDYPVLVQKQDGCYEDNIVADNLICAEGVGPAGWNRAVLTLIERI